MKAAKDGDVTTLKRLIEEEEMDFDIRGPKDYPWVS